MKKITLFYLETCPYCHNARRAIGELKEENPEYEEIEIEWIEESKKPDLAAKYDYYYVPAIYAGDEKLYEASPSEDYMACKANVRAAFDAI